MQFETAQLGWMIAQWNFALYLAVGALVYALGGLDSTALLAG